MFWFAYIIFVIFFPGAFLFGWPLYMLTWPIFLSYNLWVTIPSFDWILDPLLWIPDPTVVVKDDDINIDPEEQKPL